MQFSEPAPYASDAELARHLGYAGPPRPYRVAEESFRMLVPKELASEAAWGLLVWISPGDSPVIPASWEPELQRRRLLVVGACRSGNERDALDRCRLALDATCNVSRRFKLDRRRIYVGGFSGGGRIASILGVSYADLFAGALCVCGVDFYRPVFASPGEYYPPSYRPQSGVLALAKQERRFVLVTGERDMNRLNTKSILEHGFLPNGFKHVLYLEVPGMKHALPSSGTLQAALEFLDEAAPVTPPPKLGTASAGRPFERQP